MSGPSAWSLSPWWVPCWAEGTLHGLVKHSHGGTLGRRGVGGRGVRSEPRNWPRFTLTSHWLPRRWWWCFCACALRGKSRARLSLTAEMVGQVSSTSTQRGLSMQSFIHRPRSSWRSTKVWPRRQNPNRAAAQRQPRRPKQISATKRVFADGPLCRVVACLTLCRDVRLSGCGVHSV